MIFAEKYTTDTLDKSKRVISNDAYAIGEMIEKLIVQINQLRATW